MERGGRRPGAGRKNGSKQRANAAREAAIAELTQTPLAYLLSDMHDPSLTRTERRDAAKAAAQYVHPRLSAVQVKGEMNVHRIERIIVDPANPDAKGVCAAIE